MDGSAIVDWCVVYHQPPRQNPIGHPWAARMDLLPRDCARLRNGLGHCAYFRLLTCATMAAYDAPQ
jgi:hypothetical protein